LCDSSKTIDLGGVSKQFYTTLGESLSPLIPRGVGELPNGDSELLEQIGRWYALIDARNQDRGDKFLVGNLFPKEFFDIVNIAASASSEEDKIKAVAAKLKEIDPAMALVADTVLDPMANKDAYAEIIGCGPEESEEEAIGQVKVYLDAASAFYKGAGKVLDPSIQGEAVTSDGIIRALKPETRTPAFLQKYEWLTEKIRGSDSEWQRKFVRAVTGNDALRPKLIILVQENWRDEPTFEIHTCFNSLDLPKGNLDKESFLKLLDWSISREGYNTA